MKRLSLLGFFALATVGFMGCPIFDDSHPFDCNDSRECDGSGGSTSTAPTCNDSGDCKGINQTCGDDDQCHTGDCTLWGCADHGKCVVGDNGFATCETPGTGSGGGGGGGGGTASGGGGSGGAAPVIWCGHPADCAAGQTCAPDGTCQVGDCTVANCIFGYTCNATSGLCEAAPNACGGDADCTAPDANFECVDGQCTAPAAQCFDQNQCDGMKKCAGGKCESACAKDIDCPATSTCDKEKGVCSIPAQACAITNDCGTDGKSVCVDGGCVPRAGGDGTCPDGSAWVENGCVPSESATFTCANDGVQDACADGSICVHHSCYVSCESSFSICTGMPTFSQCQSITSASGTYAVCGAPDSLGSDCDPTQGMNCAGPGQVCVDGICK